MDRLVATCRTATLRLRLGRCPFPSHHWAPPVPDGNGGEATRGTRWHLRTSACSRWGGHDLVDRDGVKAASIVDLYIDEQTKQPTWGWCTGLLTAADAGAHGPGHRPARRDGQRRRQRPGPIRERPSWTRRAWPSARRFPRLPRSRCAATTASATPRRQPKVTTARRTPSRWMPARRARREDHGGDDLRVDRAKRHDDPVGGGVAGPLAAPGATCPGSALCGYRLCHHNHPGATRGATTGGGAGPGGEPHRATSAARRR